MMQQNLHTELAHLLAATLRDQSPHRRPSQAGNREEPRRARDRTSAAGTLTYEWKWFRGAAGDAADFDRFLAWIGVVIQCTSCQCQIDPVDVLPVVEQGEDPREYAWSCERCEEKSTPGD